MSQRIVDNHGQVTQHGDIHVHRAGALAPPADHPNSRECPQCGKATWRYTRHCLCCGLDLVAMDRETNRRRLAKKKLAIVLGGWLLSGAMLWGQQHAPASMRFGMLVVGIMVLVVAVAATKD